MTTAENIDLGVLARELELPVEQVQRTLQLLDDGNTIPFITRYRKDRTGGLDEEQIQRIQQEAVKARMLAERKQTILRSIESQGKLTPDLAARIQSARTLKWLEDVYLPFKPKKQTLATIARQRGLEPLAREILDAAPTASDLNPRATQELRPEQGLATVEDVLQGVGHILAEIFSERVDVRGRLRKAIRRDAVLICTRIDPSERTAAATAAPVGAEAVDSSEEAPAIVSPSSDAALEPEGTPDSPAETSVETGLEAVEESAPVAEPDVVTDHSLPVAAGSAPDETANTVADVSAPPLVTDSSAPAGEPAVEARTGDVATHRQAGESAAGGPPTKGLSAILSAKAVKVSKKPSKKQLAKERKKKMLETAFKDYYNFSEPVSKLPPHRTLAINRGERAKVLRIRLEYAAEGLIAEAVQYMVPEEHLHRDFLRGCARDSLQRLVLPSLERELRRELAEEAEHHALQVFIRNLRKLLLQPPVHGRRVLAVDPGFRSGCKLAAVDAFGKLIEHGMVHLVGPDGQKAIAEKTVADVVRRNQIDLIAIGNGAGCRAAEHLVSDIIAADFADTSIAYWIVNEAGASVYSTSQVGRDELPQCDPMMRSAVSIARRLQDPLSELVKINPANIGVGMYQHDMKAKHLRESLDAVVKSCVNFVGVELNSASPSLLGYVSGLNQLTARRIFEYRQQHGPFRSREQLKDVPGIGESTFVQAAGFLRITDGDQPFDATWIHPESYDLAARVVDKLGIAVTDLVSRAKPVEPSPVEPSPVEAAVVGAIAPAEASSSGESVPVEQPPVEVVSDAGPVVESTPETASPAPLAPTPNVVTNEESSRIAERLASVDVPAMAKELDVSEVLLRDILAALARPGRDPRDDFSPPPFRTGIMKLEDLKPGMELQGTVLNVVDFGAFVDIGISDSALIHISKLADQFIRDPQEVVSVGDILRVWVIEVDKERRRVSLTAIDPNSPRRTRERRERGPRKPRANQRPQQQKNEGGERKAQAGTSSSPPPARTPRPPRPPRQGPQKGGRPPRTHSPPSPPKPVKPITPGMLAGKQPMRSFSDLLQFYDRKKTQEPGEPSQ